MLRRDVALFTLGSVVSGGLAWALRKRGDDRKRPILGGWPRVVVLGAGFGGLRVAHGLAGAEADVLVLDRHNYHCFQPLLYQVATAGLEPEEIAHPLREMFRNLPNVRFRMASVERIDLEGRQVLTDSGAIPYDYLVIAAGSQTNYFGMDDLAGKSFALKELNGAVELRNQLLSCFERATDESDPARRAALLTFVVAGGGPTGVEFAGALAELIRLVLVHDYPGLDVKQSRVILVEAGPAILPPFDVSLQKAAIRSLRQKGVDVRVHAPVKGYDGEVVLLGDGTTIPTHTLVWAAGVRASGLAASLGLPLARGGRVPVQPTLQLAEHPEVFLIGDLAYLEQEGKPLPQVAPVAIQMGELAAANIRRKLTGRPLESFHYVDKGSMATIGRNAAVAQIGRVRLTGFAAWVTWLFVHLLQLVGFRNRLLVLVN